MMCKFGKGLYGLKNKKQTWRLTAGLSAAVLLASLPLPAGGVLAAGSTGAATAAAEADTASLTKTQVMDRAGEIVSIPAEFTLEGASLTNNHSLPPTWNLRWKSEGDESKYIHMEIDARTGTLIEYSRDTGKSKKTGGNLVEEEKALGSANGFLIRALPKEEWENLSEPNEFGLNFDYYYDSAQERVYTFTRMHDGIPFIENGVQIVTDRAGVVVKYKRYWTDEPLPEAKDILAEEEAVKRLAEKTRPSLVVVDLPSRRSGFSFDEHDAFYEKGEAYKLVYGYLGKDPRYLDAKSGKMLNIWGTEAKDYEITPLGNTISKSTGEKSITQAEAKKIADDLLKKLPGSYRFLQFRGGSSAQNLEQVVERHAGMEYVPADPQKEKTEKVTVIISPKGELLQYYKEINSESKKVDKAISYEQAKEIALQMVKTLMPERLGELYLIERNPPSDQEVEEILASGNRNYVFSYGLLIDGIPFDPLYLDVRVKPGTGELVEFGFLQDAKPPATLPAAKIDREAAKKIEQKNQKAMLTYFLPENWMDKAKRGEKQTPMLVYRNIGDEGLVDAVTGEWIILDKQREKESKGRK